ncbi:two-component sensor histidine kinase [Kitasatospora sp. MMS16-BH015]|uniref:sensor histidine kinase n=1 Tax=Kitasatospora sp. MMS16-BH015 TaxID=2018025 RepID=UPI000CA3531F|nr:HAMP domain-containing sensor histidine kinase [Kitasatospora sp. MMS16-BH015]AUG76890.1 two-component sensor histidine kinase [Kitasatospora sp. MMS16-BH015]
MLTAEARIRRLRWRLTALFALTSALALAGLAGFAIYSDSNARRDQLDDRLRLRGTATAKLIVYDDQDRLDIQSLLDIVGTECPQVTMVTVTSDTPAIAYAPPKPCMHAAEADVRRLATTAVAQHSAVSADGHTADGRPVRLFAAPFDGPSGESAAGAVVLAADASGSQAQHQLRLVLIIGSLVLVSVSGLAGHLLSGRAIRPALTSLRQQEEFLADAAHDLRTPAATLRALAATALHEQAGHPQPAARTSALQRTEHLAARMGDLIDGLLTRARLMAGVATPVREPLRLDQLVEAVVEDTDTQGHRVTVVTERAVVVGDVDLLHRAVANLLGNALAHGHAPGVPAEVRLAVTGDGTVTVDDSGPGVPPELAGSLFERHRSGSGSSGLGLSIASWVAHVHGGSLTVATSPTGGARFVLRLATS